MKILPAVSTLAAVLVFVSSLRADYQVTITMSSPGQPAKEYVAKIKGTRIRTEMDSGNAVITDRKTGLRVLLMAASKQASDMSDLGKAMQDTADKQPNPKLVPTGKKESVAGYEAEEFTYGLDEDTKISIWAAKDYPKDKAEALMTLYRESGSKTYASLPDLSVLPGPVIRSVVKDKSGAVEIDSIVKSVTEANFDDKEFEVPADYTMKKRPARSARKEPKPKQ